MSIQRQISLVATVVVCLLVVIFPGCTEEEVVQMPSPAVPLSPVTNLRAYSANAITVGLTWTASADVGQADFVEHQITAMVGANTVSVVTAPKESTHTSVTNLIEGVIYTFEVVAVATPSSQTYVSSDTVDIQWAPARRLTMDGPIDIDVYEIASTVGGSGLQFFDAGSGGPQVLSIAASAGYQDIIDVLLDTTSSGVIILESAHLNPLLVGQARSTKFSSIEVPSDSLNVGQSEPPDLGTYDRDLVTIGSSAVATGKIFYAISADSNYVRILVKRDSASGTLLFGDSPNRRIRVELSYQGAAGVPFAKPKP